MVNKIPPRMGRPVPTGLGPDGTVPDSASGVGLRAGREPNTFEPEEELEASAQGAEDMGDTPADPSDPDR